MVRYRIDDMLGPVVESAPERYLGLARWLADDAGSDFDVVLDALEMIDAALNHREQRSEWGSDEYAVEFGPDSLTITNYFAAEGTPVLSYGLDEAREVIEEYALYLIGLPDKPNPGREYRPDLAAWQADLLAWEEEWEQRHPYRGRLGIPETGPA